MNKLDVKALGLTVGIFWSLYCVLLGLTSMLLDFGTPLLELLSCLYVGYKPTPLGAVIGGLWAFLDGFIAGAVVAWLYNRLVRQ
jgi:hypothetical protein